MSMAYVIPEQDTRPEPREQPGQRQRDFPNHGPEIAGFWTVASLVVAVLLVASVCGLVLLATSPVRLWRLAQDFSSPLLVVLTVVGAGVASFAFLASQFGVR